MTRAIATSSRPIRLPVHLLDKLCKFNRAIAQFEQATGRSPSQAEVAAIAKEVEIPPAKLPHLLALEACNLASLNALTGMDTALCDLVLGVEDCALERLATQAELATLMAAAGLSPAEMQIVRRRIVPGYRPGLGRHPTPGGQALCCRTGQASAGSRCGLEFYSLRSRWILKDPAP